ncbi:MAG: hypothetical protein WC645_00005, partial [Candidatus Margulisiibacteriota bacterium]
PGVYGESSSGAGVYGISAGAAGTAGVRGVSSGTNGWGVYGASANGYGVGGNGVNVGVWGTSTGTATTALPMLGAGVYGNNTQTTIPSGRIAAPGVYGESSGNGVHGKSTGSAYAGGNFESVDGFGVWAESKSSTKAGIYARNKGPDGIAGNADDGIALSVGEGKIKIRNGSATIAYWGPAGSIQEVTTNGAVGTITYPSIASGHDVVIKVNNSYVTTGSKIFFGGLNSRTALWSGPNNGNFTILVAPVSATGGAGTIDFLVIN